MFRHISLLALLLVCGCISASNKETITSSTVISIQGGDCQGLATDVDRDNCYLNMAHNSQNTSLCELITNAALRGTCVGSVNLEYSLRETTTTSTSTSTTESSTTSTIPETTTTSMSSTSLSSEVGMDTSDCVANMGFNKDSVYYSYTRGCGSKYMNDVSAASRQTGIDIEAINVQATSGNNNFNLLECFYGKFDENNREFKVCPRLLCPRTGKYLTLESTATGSIQSQMILFAEECQGDTRASRLIPQSASDGMESTSTTIRDGDITPSVAGLCNSTNPSVDYYVKGTTIGVNGQKTDLCVVSEKYPDHNRVRKYYCNPEGFVMAKEYTCPLQCVDGACTRHRTAGL
jgi:hypothetical protein